jgi:tetratricopeptide (TPR) repeat protein
MKYTLTLIAILISQLCIAQQIGYKEWQEEAKADIRLLPEYGNVTKTKEQVEDDDELIKTSLKIDTTHRKASDHLVTLGFTYLSRGDIKTAMYRFNQAYLLDPKNENIYWGYGAIYGTFNDYQTAIVQYDKGLSINPKSATILTDKATLYFVKFQQDNDQVKLNTAIDLLKKSYEIDSNSVNTTYKLSICYFLNKDCTNAWKFYKECKKVGGQPIAENYTDALKKMCAN